MSLSNRIGMFCLVALGVLSSVASAGNSPRMVSDLDGGWKFIKQDIPDAEQILTDDSAWQSINLPHTWNNLDGEDGGNNYYRGVGWYRLHLKSDPAWLGKDVYIKFDAASIDASVYVNGKLAGTHAGAFAAFCFDITSLLNPAGDNVIAVKVNNAMDPNVAPLSGDFTVFGGIYRDVHLIVTNPLSISPIDHASSGVYVRQKSVDAHLADFSVTTKLRFPDLIHGRRPSVHMQYDLVDAGGMFVRTLTQDVDPAKSDVVQEIKLPNPHLWNARKDPYLYTLRVSVLDGQTVTDTVEQPVGLRFFRVDPQQGFFLNGQPYRLLGVNRHQDHLDQGWAISLADHQSDFADMMEMGCTGVRLSHYQHAQEFYDLCDRGGIVVWAELPIVNQVNTTPEFDDNAKQQLSELIQQSFNHPSICFWSLSNELGGRGPKGVSAADEKKHQVELMTALNEQAKRMDPGRLTTQASSSQPGQAKDGITDVIAFNRYHGWYGGKPDQLGADLDKIHSVYPDRAVGLSEYGAGAAVTQHEANVKQPKANNSKWHPEEWQAIVHEQAWAAIKPRNWIWGTFLWCEHDFASDGRNEGDHAGRNDKGLVTYDGKTKKDAFYFYKANWAAQPMVYITDRRFSPRAAGALPVKIYSNCDSVDLSVNGKSLGSKTGSDIKIFQWENAELKPGENTLTAVGTRDGKTYSDSCVIVFDKNAKEGPTPGKRQ